MTGRWRRHRAVAGRRALIARFLALPLSPQEQAFRRRKMAERAEREAKKKVWRA